VQMAFAQHREGFAGEIEFDRQGTIAPRVFHDVAAIRCEGEIHAQTAGCVGKDPDLVAGSGCKEEKMLGHVRYTLW